MKIKICEICTQMEYIDLNEVKKVLKQKECIKHYAYIIHNKDNIKEHIHLMLRFNNAYDIKNVADWFGIQQNYISRIKGKFGDALEYLTHKNAPEKFQYADSNVVTNFDFVGERDKNIENKKKRKKKNELIEKIGNGEIKQYNIQEFCNIKEYCKWKTDINNAFEYRIKTIKNNNNRDMQVVYIQGASGTGKTTLAKKMAENYYNFRLDKEEKLNYYISSSSNDILDGYEGQECLILDDLRPSCMGLSDLLKMLDNNTSSLVKSRYYNKVLECKLLIITTVLDINTFFCNVFKEQQEPILQLKRRCKTLIKINGKIEYYLFDNVLKEYTYCYAVPNNVTRNIKIQSIEEQKEILQKQIIAIL